MQEITEEGEIYVYG